MEDYVFDKCREINNLLQANNENKARDELIRLLDYHATNELPYTPLVNHLIRGLGLYPYLDEETSTLQDQYVCNLFKVDVGLEEEKPLHIDQYKLLRYLVEGRNIAVSAPTSFGKSFVIDAFIKIRRPQNVMILVPTIALMDETRRRLYKKFSEEYTIITTAESELGEKNLFIFPPERAMLFVNRIERLDMFIVDEFYKSSKVLETERSDAFVEAIMRYGEKSNQRYYLAPNISSLQLNQFTEGMEFVKLDVKTVCLNEHDYTQQINGDANVKNEIFKKLMQDISGKTLIYAGSHKQTTNVSNLIMTAEPEKETQLLTDFSNWLGENYDYNWNLTLLVQRGFGIHNGRLHRPISQVQVSLFEKEDGLDRIISTSSIIEGVNTSAENVIVWMTTGRGLRFNNFSYKNLIGRAGRMFRYFVGNIYILANPPVEESTELTIDFPEPIEGSINPEEFERYLTAEQIAKIHAYDAEMERIVDGFKELKQDGVFQSSDMYFVGRLAHVISERRDKWRCLYYLTMSNPDSWTIPLKHILRNSQIVSWSEHDKLIGFVKIISQNWIKTIPELLDEMEDIDVGIDEFFRLERLVSYQLATLVNDINVLQKKILKSDFDLSDFKSKLSCVFLPPVVYYLEEFGLPRMLARKIQQAGLVNFEDEELSLDDALNIFREIGKNKITQQAKLDGFELYILDYFYDGITK